MAVPTYNRTESNYAALNSALETSKEIYGLLQNNKIFSDDIKKTVGKAIGDTTSEFLRKISLIHHLEPHDEKSYKERIRQQLELIAVLKSIEPLFDVAKNIAGVRADYFERLAFCINETESAIKKWLNLEKKKYEKFLTK